MKRRELFKVGFAATVIGIAGPVLSQERKKSISLTPMTDLKNIRDEFPYLEDQIYLDASGMMPLPTFGREALDKYIAVQHLGDKRGDRHYFNEAYQNCHRLFAKLINADKEEVTEISCTKAGEQMVLDSLPALKNGGNIVTNDLHFSGSLHNLLGLKKAGLDVRIVKAKNFKVTAEDMAAAMDDKTALVSITLLSNVNGHKEEIKKLSQITHTRGALLYADIVQAAGIIPIDVKDMGIDVAACSCYKWLYGVHGTAFLYVKKDLQGTTLNNLLYPGGARHNYAPWVETPDSKHGDFKWREPTTAHRYQPGHFSYLGFCAAYEGLKFIHANGVEKLLAHSVKLNKYLLDNIDQTRFKNITPDPSLSPILTFKTKPDDDIPAKLKKANIKASFRQHRLRISPGIYNNQSDMVALLKALS